MNLCEYLVRPMIKALLCANAKKNLMSKIISNSVLAHDLYTFRLNKLSKMILQDLID